MVVTEQFVYLHLPKTGGTFVTEILKRINRLYPRLNARELKHLKHEGIKRIPSAARGLPIVTSVRPPFEHYISRYEFKWWRRPDKKEYRPHLVRKRYPDFPNLSFSDFLRYRSDWDLVPLSRVKETSEREKLRKILKKRRIGFNSFELIDLISMDSLSVFDRIDDLTRENILESKHNIAFLFQPTLSSDLYKCLVMFGVPEDIASISLTSGYIKPKYQGTNSGLSDKRAYYTVHDIEYVLDIDRIIFRMFRHFKVNIP